MSPLDKPLRLLSCFGSLFLLSLIASTSVNASCIYTERIKAQEMEMGNVITWSTSKEKENQTFVVQKSMDGLEFITEGIVRGAGNSDMEKHYRYLDLSVGQPKAFYRLVDIDTKGHYTISETVVVNRNKENNMLITEMSQTETDRYFTLTLQSEVADQLRYNVFDIANVIVKNGSTDLVKGKNIIAMDLNGLEVGKYRLMLQSREEQEEVFIVKNNPDGTTNKTNFALKNNKKDKE